MEMHMVHEDASKACTVVSLLFSTKQAGKPSKTISHLGPYFRRLAGKEGAEEQVKEPVDPTEWIDEASGYYIYDGSFTTPLCTEGVIWTIMSKVKHISKEQIHLLQSVTKLFATTNLRLKDGGKSIIDKSMERLRYVYRLQKSPITYAYADQGCHK